MEETLGKRIAANRKRLKLTQDQLAEQLGVTAQAVSKWENDQSCPDILLIPKLAGIFGISTDALLGCSPDRPEKVYVAEAEDDQQEPQGLHIQNGQWEFHYDSGKKSAIGLAIWVLLCGGIMLVSNLMNLKLSFWEVSWPTALLIFGLWGLYPKFSVFCLGCTLFGGYFMLENFGITSFGLSGKLIFPICLLLFGLSLLADAIKKPRKPKFQINHDHRGTFASECNLGEDNFQCHTSFGENSFYIDLPRLTGGTAGVSFGEQTVDLRGCEEVSENCSIEANCSFGELKILVPKHYLVKANPSSAFGALEYQGQPNPNPQGTILLNANVSFGEIEVHYI